MRIIEISESIPKGSYLNGIFAFDQAKALAKQGHEVIFAVVDLRSVRRKRRLGIQHYEQDGLKVFSIAIPVGAVPAGIKDPIGKWALKRLFRLIESEYGSPDVVHAHFLDMGVLAADLCNRENLPLVITEHSSSLNRDVLPEITRKRAKYAYSSAKKVIAVSSALAARIRAHTGAEAIVVPNIVDMPEITLDRQKKNTEPFKFVSAGNLNKGKGFDVLLRAFAEVAKSNPNISLLIMGGGVEADNLKSLVRTLELEEKVSFYGPFVREQFAEELEHSDAFVLASRGETFGVVYTEALSCGLPIIATYCGGPEDFVNSSNGVLVQVDNVQELSIAMTGMLNTIDKYDREQISKSAKIHFSSEGIAIRVTEILKGIVEEIHEKD